MCRAAVTHRFGWRCISRGWGVLELKSKTMRHSNVCLVKLARFICVLDVDARAAQHVCGVRAVGCMSVELGMWWWGRNMRTGVLNVPEAGWSKRAGG